MQSKAVHGSLTFPLGKLVHLEFTTGMAHQYWLQHSEFEYRDGIGVGIDNPPRRTCFKRKKRNGVERRQKFNVCQVSLGNIAEIVSVWPPVVQQHNSGSKGHVLQETRGPSKASQTMPPQSRGDRSDSGPSDSPPTLKPFLDNLPSPRGLLADQRTPTSTSRRSTVTADRDVPTPTRSSSNARLRSDGSEEGDGKDDSEGVQYELEGAEEENDEDTESMTLDDDEFESHYSRRSSSASSQTAGSEDDDQYDDDAPLEMHTPNANGLTHPHLSHSHLNRLTRITSLPISHASPPSTLATSHSTTSLRPPPPPPPLYPPFYNRPPTPLPPSPSLTSLLRPPSLLNRSTTSTRPTTPDSSDVETPLDTEAAVAHSARRAHPLPPTSPKVPTYEYYGFTLYLASTLAFIIYILWSYLPSPFLHALGISYYPNRYWSLALPAWIVMALVFVYVALLTFNVEYLTLDMREVECLVDEAGNVAVLDEHGRVRHGGSKRLEKEAEERRRYEEQRLLAERERRNSSLGSKSGKKKRRDKARAFSQSQGHSRNSSEHYSGRTDSQQLYRDHRASPTNPNDFFSYGYFFAGRRASASTTHDTDGQNRPSAAPVVDLSYQQIWNHGTDGVMDIPIGGVCEVLYGDGDSDGE